PGSLGGAPWSAPMADWANAVETTIRVVSSAAIDRLASLFADCLFRIRIIGLLTATLTSAPDRCGPALLSPGIRGSTTPSRPVIAFAWPAYRPSAYRIL